MLSKKSNSERAFYAVIMAGGSGTRFWPLSRKAKPKQVLALLNSKSLIRESVERLSPLLSPNQVFVITQEAQTEIIRRELPMLSAEQIIKEPFGRDTAACIGLMALILQRHSKSAVFCCLPADHYIVAKDKFQRTLKAAATMAQQDVLVTIGVQPTYPSTAYGYLQRGDLLDEKEGIRAYKVRRFCEKPDRDSAERFVASKEFYWNSGMFVWKASTILAAIERYAVPLHRGLMKICDAWGTPKQTAVLQAEYERFRKTSIDFAVMEHAENAVMVEADFDWDDVGSFLALAAHKTKDVQGNTIEGAHCGIEASNLLVLSDEPQHLIATIGLKDMLIVHTTDVTLLCPKERADDIKKLVEKISEAKLEKYL